MVRSGVSSVDHDNTVTDLFCGAGGSALGATAVPSFSLAMCANHWARAVETHADNFPDTAHDIANISQVDPRRYPRTRVLWASPECTNHSQARGKRRADQQPDLFDEVLPDSAAERSRATMWDVIRFADHHRYQAIIVENVVDAAKWVLFDAWLRALRDLGYHYKIVYLNSMHAPGIAAPRAPQSRDRMYVVAWRGTTTPYLEPRPLAWCPQCERNVEAMQVFKKDNHRWGRYRAQYVYKCPTPRCHVIVEPYADPAATAIDWTIKGERIGSRAKPLSANTIRRIESGLAKFGRPMTFEATGNTYVRPNSDYARAWPVDQPTATLTTSQTRALLVPSGGSWRDEAESVSTPMTTRTAVENDGLLVPSFSERGSVRTTGEPMGTQTTRQDVALVVPYYRTGTARLSSEPLPTMTTVDTAGLALPPAAADSFIAELRGGGSDTRHVLESLATVTASGNNHMLVRMNGTSPDAGQMCTPLREPARTVTAAGHQALVEWDAAPPEVDDCLFRMLVPAEIGRAMAFREDYRVGGTNREKVRQFGNAVTPPAAEFLFRAIAPVLA